MVHHRRRPILILVILALFLMASPAIAQQGQTAIEDITDHVSEMRQLPVEHQIELTVMTRDELRAEMASMFETDYPADERYADMREMAAFGLIPPDTDLGELVVALYGEQVLGFYDPSTGELVVVRDGDQDGEFTATEKVTYFHEIVHALQDQNFDLDAGPLNEDNVSDDESLAIDALIEGDASYSEVQFVISDPDLLDAYLKEIESADFNTDVLDEAPKIIQDTLVFPYDQGFTFVEALHNEGGWSLVDSAYANPPASTEQVLHPEKYLAGEAPVDVAVNDFSQALGDDWTVWDINTFGEFQIRSILQDTSMSDQQAEVAATGWGGDTYVVAGTDDTDAIHWVSVWDSEKDASEFTRAWALREAERWGVDPVFVSDSVIEFRSDDAIARITLNGTTVDYLMAPDAATLDAIVNAAPAIPAATPVASPVASPVS